VLPVDASAPQKFDRPSPVQIYERLDSGSEAYGPVLWCTLEDGMGKMLAATQGCNLVCFKSRVRSGLI
jgi:hypothetical protein